MKANSLSFYSLEKSYYTDGITLKENIREAMRKVNFKKIEESNYEFTGLTLPSLFSFSERVTVDFIQLDQNEYLVELESKCLFPFQIFDWGKNRRNCDRFFKCLDSLNY